MRDVHFGQTHIDTFESLLDQKLHVALKRFWYTD